jgi:hypothetical protein
VGETLAFVIPEVRDELSGIYVVRVLVLIHFFGAADPDSRASPYQEYVWVQENV